MIEISLVASFEMILFNKQIKKALISLRGCAGWYVPFVVRPPDRVSILVSCTSMDLTKKVSTYDQDTMKKRHRTKKATTQPK